MKPLGASEWLDRTDGEVEHAAAVSCCSGQPLSDGLCLDCPHPPPRSPSAVRASSRRRTAAVLICVLGCGLDVVKMGKKEVTGKTGGSGLSHQSTTLRQQRSGIKVNVSKNAPSMLRLEHLKNLANWASGELCVPPLAALLGHHLSSAAEEIGIPLDASLLSCQRCETVMQPGRNCVIRIEKNKAKRQKHRKCKLSQIRTQNNIVYHCNFCLHKNVKGGTRKGYMKEVYSSSSKQASNVDGSFSKPGKDIIERRKQAPEMEPLSSKEYIPKRCSENPMDKTPILKSQENRVVGNDAGSSRKSTKSMSEKGGVSSSKKRRRKGWTSLKEIAERKAQENKNRTSLLSIPFLL